MGFVCMHLFLEARCLQGLLVAPFLQDPDTLHQRVALLGHQEERGSGPQAGGHSGWGAAAVGETKDIGLAPFPGSRVAPGCPVPFPSQ